MEAAAPALAPLVLSLPHGNTAAAMTRRTNHATLPPTKKNNTSASSSTPTSSVHGDSTKPWVVDKFDQYLFPYLLDIYSVVPTYQWNRISSRFSKIMTVATVAIAALYIYITLDQFCNVQPELILRSTYTVSNQADVDVFQIPMIAFGVSYTHVNATTGEEEARYLDARNEDPYFTWELEHKTILEQFKGGKLSNTIPPEYMVSCNELLGLSGFPLFCIHPNHRDLYNLQGEFIFDKYEYLNFKLNRCVNVTPTQEKPCASPEDVLDVVQSSDSVEIQLFVRSDRYDVSALDNTNGNDNGNANNGPLTYFDRSWRWFGKVGYSLQHEVYLRHTEIEINRRFLDDSLKQNPVVELLEFSHLDSYDRPQGTDYVQQEEYLEFFVRMNTSAQKAQVIYPSGSIITLVTLWGAFLNILVNFSLGLLTRTANLRLFDNRFNRSTKKIVQGNTNTTIPTTSKEAAVGRFCGKRRSKYNRRKSVDDIKTESRRTTATAAYRATKTNGYDDLSRFPLDKMDIRLVDAETLDKYGRFVISKEELLIPSTVFGELRLFALEQHRKRQRAAYTLCRFFVKYVKPCRHIGGGENRARSLASGDLSSIVLSGIDDACDA